MIVAIIGLGNIGKWHFESLKKTKLCKQVFLIDKNHKKEKLIKDKKNKFFFYNKIPDDLKKIDLLIHATQSRNRLEVLKEISNKKIKIKTIIFEKIVASTAVELKKIKYFIKKNKVNCYVNCPRRFFDFYQLLKTKIQKKKIVFSLNGCDNLNLGSNLIHVIDLFCFLTGDEKIEIVNLDFFKVRIKNNKVYFNGTFIFKNIYGKLIINDKPKNYYFAPEIKIKIENNNKEYIISESKRIFYLFDKNKKKLKKGKFKFHNQSDLTSQYVKELYNNEKINLVTFDKSFLHHEIVLKIFNKLVKKYKLSNRAYIT